MSGTGAVPASWTALGAEQESRAPVPPLHPFLKTGLVCHSWVPCLNHKHSHNLDFRKPLQPGAGLVLLRGIQLKLSLGWPAPLRQAMFTGHLGDADVCQITLVLVNGAKQRDHQDNVTCNEPPGEFGASNWGGIKIQACPKNTSPRGCPTPTPGSRLNRGVIK